MGACFEQSTQQLKIERSKTDPTSGLNYKERSTNLVATIDVIGVCLPGVNPNVLADTFLSCSNGKVEEVCTMVKRGWLEDKEGKSVVNENALLATFKELDGGEDAVRECLQIPEVYEYYYYDYADYFDDYNYLEESASGNRQRRAADGKTARNRNGKTAKKTRKQPRKKAKKEANKESSNAEKDAQKKALSKLGLKKMPSKSTLEKLSCVQDKITELLVGCSKNILSKTN